MEKAVVKAVVENRFRELGAKQLELYPSGTCWTMKGEFFKVSTFTDCFEDIVPMPYDISGFHGFLDTHEILNSQACSFP